MNPHINVPTRKQTLWEFFMNKLVSFGLATLAVSISACTTTAKPPKTSGRVIEYKSDSNGFDTKTFFYEGENEVIAFDSQFTPELAKASIEHLRKHTNKPISWLVITHPNPDKFNGASAFKAIGAKILASKSTADAIPEVHGYKQYYFVEMAKMFTKEQYPQPTAVDQTFSKEMALVLKGGERIELFELSQPGVSSTQTVAYIDRANALFVGDLVHNEAHAWLEGGIVKGKPTPTIDGWIAGLNELRKLFRPDALVYGGRGKVMDLESSVSHQIDYLTRAKLLVTDEIDLLGESASDFNGPKSGMLYKMLAERFRKSFPTYELPYMIEYGAYGLVQAELSKK